MCSFSDNNQAHCDDLLRKNIFKLPPYWHRLLSADVVIYMVTRSLNRGS